MINKTLSILKLILLGIIAITLVGILILILNIEKVEDYYGPIFEKQTSNILSKEEIISSEITKIYANMKSSDIIVQESNVEEATVKVYGDKKENIQIVTNQETLEIIETKRNQCFGICIGRYIRIVIEIPREKEYSFDIKTISGDVDITTNISQIDLKTTSGDIYLSQANKVNVETVSGDIEIQEVTEALEIKTTSGDIEIASCQITQNSNIQTISGDVDISRLGDIYVNTKTTTGDVKTPMNNRNATVELNIQTVSGDIETMDD